MLYKVYSKVCLICSKCSSKFVQNICSKFVMFVVRIVLSLYKVCLICSKCSSKFVQIFVVSLFDL